MARSVARSGSVGWVSGLGLRAGSVGWVYCDVFQKAEGGIKSIVCNHFIKSDILLRRQEIYTQKFKMFDVLNCESCLMFCNFPNEIYPG